MGGIVYGLGVLAILLRNLEPGATLTARVLAFTPKPRILDLEVAPDGEDTVTMQGLHRKTARYVADGQARRAWGRRVRRRQAATPAPLLDRG